jgi:hypothetical protein
MASFNEIYSLDKFIYFGFTYEDVYENNSFCFVINYKEDAIYVNNFKCLMTLNFETH